MPPATPTLTVAPSSSLGRNVLVIANSDTPAGLNDIYRSASNENGGVAFRIATGVAVDGTFNDYNIASDVVYTYFARALDGSGIGSDSVSQTGSVDLADFFLHAFTKTSATGNASGNVLSGANIGSTGSDRSRSGTEHVLSGRDQIVVINSSVDEFKLQATLRTATAQAETDYEAIFETGLYVCARDQHGNKIIGVLERFLVEYHVAFTDLRIEVMKVGVSEAV